MALTMEPPPLTVQMQTVFMMRLHILSLCSSLHLMREIMEITKDLCQALQRKYQDILNTMYLVSTTKALIQKYREDGWLSLLEDVQLFCGEHGIDSPITSARYTWLWNRNKIPFYLFAH